MQVETWMQQKSLIEGIFMLMDQVKYLNGRVWEFARMGLLLVLTALALHVVFSLVFVYAFRGLGMPVLSNFGQIIGQCLAIILVLYGMARAPFMGPVPALTTAGPVLYLYVVGIALLLSYALPALLLPPRGASFFSAFMMGQVIGILRLLLLTVFVALAFQVREERKIDVSEAVSKAISALKDWWLPALVFLIVLAVLQLILQSLQRQMDAGFLRAFVGLAFVTGPFMLIKFILVLVLMTREEDQAGA